MCRGEPGGYARTSVLQSALCGNRRCSPPRPARPAQTIWLACSARRVRYTVSVGAPLPGCRPWSPSSGEPSRLCGPAQSGRCPLSGAEPGTATGCAPRLWLACCRWPPSGPAGRSRRFRLAGSSTVQLCGSGRWPQGRQATAATCSVWIRTLRVPTVRWPRHWRRPVWRPPCLARERVVRPCGSQGGEGSLGSSSWSASPHPLLQPGCGRSDPTLVTALLLLRAPNQDPGG